MGAGLVDKTILRRRTPLEGLLLLRGETSPSLIPYLVLVLVLVLKVCRFARGKEKEN